MYDRNLNGELDAVDAPKRNLDAASNDTEEGNKFYSQMAKDNHMVFKAGNIRSLTF
jgi:hypothetical protein